MLTVEASLKNKTNKHIKQQKLNMQIAKYPVILFGFIATTPPSLVLFFSQNSVNQTEKLQQQKNGNFFPLLLKRVTHHTAAVKAEKTWKEIKN